MHAIENRQQLIDQIKQKELKGLSQSSSNQPFHGSETPNQNLQALAKHVASEAIDKCLKEHGKRTSQFTSELKQKRLEKIESILSIS